METRRAQGFTLVEMLTVLFIVSILICVILGASSYAIHVGRVSRAKSDLAAIADALDRYCVIFGDYPDVVDGTNLVTHTAHLGNPDMHRMYSFANFLPRGFTGRDPWGRSYRYETHHEGGEGGDPVYTLYSHGPILTRDGTEVTDDDIRCN